MKTLLGTAILLVLGLLAVAAHQRGAAPVVSRPELANPSVLDLLHAGRKIEAIKLYRHEHGVGLKEAKDAVDQLAQGLPETR